MLDTSYPCVCGHVQDKHHRDNANDMLCYECWDICIDEHNSYLAFQIVYHEFVPDNLRYLEQCLDK